ncbi:hypothetical protein M0Q97_13545 [Candidatus Dojkabacteria bacterium]|jgi:hypothetical protein|nr:hypothetical protein [Candidatus Dojkabacteria bacterium]
METLIILKWICGICFLISLVKNLIEYGEKKDWRNLEASMGWFCAFIWLLI